MLKSLLLTLGLSLGTFSFCQTFSYVFSLESVLTPGEAKGVINEIRDLLGVKIVKFDDETDHFEILTHLEWEIEEMTFDFESIGYTVVGSIVKTNIE